MMNAIRIMKCNVNCMRRIIENLGKYLRSHCLEIPCLLSACEEKIHI